MKFLLNNENLQINKKKKLFDFLQCKMTFAM